MDSNSDTMKRAIICGGTGFIGHHMARRLKLEGYYVVVVDIKKYEYGDEHEFCDDFIQVDLRNKTVVLQCLLHNFDEVYCFACQMGGAGYVFTGENDADIMHDSALINLNIVDALRRGQFKGKVFYSSSACMYPQELQNRIHEDGIYTYSLKESDAYPGNPDSEYGWEKLFSERLYLACARNWGLDVRIARFHNIYGPEGTYKGGREKAPAAMCRKVIEANEYIEDRGNTAWIRWDGLIEVWGTGQQTRSFLYIDDCIDAVRLLMQSNFKEPINIGSEEVISINGLAKMAIEISGKDIKIRNVQSKAIGVNGRNSDNTLIERELGWKPKYSLRYGLEKTFNWIKSQYGL